MTGKNDTDLKSESNERILLPEEKIDYVVDLINSGDDEKLKEINQLITVYKFSSLKLAEIIKKASINKILNVKLELLHPKAVVRVINCCVNVINMSRDIKLINKCQRVLDVSCDMLYNINFGHDELLELADIDYKRVTEYITSVSNDFNLQAKILLTKEKANNVINILKSGDVEKIKSINEMIEKYKFSHDRLAHIIDMTPMEILEHINTDLLIPKILIKVIACCVHEIKWSKDKDKKEKFQKVYDIAFNQLQYADLDTDDYLEMAKIADEKILQLASMNNHYNVQSTVLETTRLSGIKIRI